MNKKVRWALGVGALLLALAGALQWQPASDREPAASGAAGVAGARPGTAPSAGAPALTAVPPRAMGPAAAIPPDEAQARYARELALTEQQWCTHAKEANRQAEESLKQGEPTADQSDPSRAQREERALQAQAKLPGVHAQFAAHRRVLGGWVEQLNRQGDLRSRGTALAVALEMTYEADAKRRLQAQLQAMALQGRDPYVLALWRHASHACAADPSCSPPSPERWSQIEPDNLWAWLPDSDPHSKPLSDAQWQGIASARYARRYGQEFLTRLLPLLPDRPGLESEQALQTLSHVSNSLDAGSDLTALTLACLGQEPASLRRAACLNGANLAWTQQQPSVSDKLFAMNLATFYAPERSPEWTARWAEFQSLGLGGGRHWADVLRPTDAPRFREQPGCEAQFAWRQHLQDLSRHGSWGIAKAKLSNPRP